MAKRKNKLPKIGKKQCRSQFEYNVYKGLTHCLPRGATLTYETDELDYVLYKTYIPDFTIKTKDGRIIYVEAKGLGRAFDYSVRQKMIAVKENHPDKDIRIVFMSDKPFRKGGTMRPSDWAQKHNFTFAIGEIPEDWFE